MMAFDVLFPELAKNECRTLRPINNPDLLAATFRFRERSCADLGCDCRRVLLEVCLLASTAPASPLRLNDVARQLSTDYPRPMISRDTDAAAHAAQVAALRRLGPDGRVRIAVELSEATRKIAIDGLVRRRPELSESEAMRIVTRPPSSTRQ